MAEMEKETTKTAYEIAYQQMLQHKKMMEAMVAVPGSIVQAPSSKKRTLQDMVAARLGLPQDHKLPFNYFHVQGVGETIVSFIVHENKHHTIEDDASLFPSDTYITKLRLLLG